MNQLRIKRSSIYTIEVNDKGETIQFDLEDLELPFKLDEAYRKVNKIANAVKAKRLIIEKKEDIKSPDGIMSSREREIMLLYKESFKQMREAMDCFLGEGGCQKIFGDVNYLTMYDDLLEELKPHIKKMNLNVGSVIERIEKKYSDSSDNVLS